MYVDGGVSNDLNTVGAQAAEMEDMGYSGVMTAETAHDPFFPLLVAAQNTQRVQLMTSIAVAFARSPMTLANIGHDLNAFSKGRFVLGLGCKYVRTLPNDSVCLGPVLPLACASTLWLCTFDCWHQQQPLEFTGEFYTHTLMTPFFTPTNVDYGAPKVFLAAVGPKMTEVVVKLQTASLCMPSLLRSICAKQRYPRWSEALRKQVRSAKTLKSVIRCLL